MQRKSLAASAQRSQQDPAANWNVFEEKSTTTAACQTDNDKCSVEVETRITIPVSSNESLETNSFWKSAAESLLQRLDKIRDENTELMGEIEWKSARQVIIQAAYNEKYEMLSKLLADE